MDTLSYRFLSDGDPPEDDIDELFKKLQPLKPPPDLIRRILSHAQRLPGPQKLPPGPPPFENRESVPGADGPIVRNERKEPS